MTHPDRTAPEPAPTAPSRPRVLSPAAIAEIEHLHAEVNAASEASEHSRFGGKGRKRLRTALRAEDEALGRLGFSSHADFHAATQPGATPWPTLADLNARTQADVDPTAAPEARDAETEPEPGEAETDAEPQAETDAEPDQTAVELTRVQAELERVHAELEAAQAAATEAETAKRRLSESEVELERLRAELADVTTTRFTDESELDRVRAEAEAELERVRNLANAELIELASQLTTFQNETARVAEASARNHREELERVAAELQATRELTANAGAEVLDATRSRDAAIDELARYRAEIDKAHGELGAARAESARLQETSATALARAAEAEAALGSARADSQQDVVRLDALTRQQEAELAGLRARLGEATNDADAVATVRRDLAQAHDELDQARAEVASVRELTDRLTGDLEAARRDVDAARQELESTRAESESRRAEWDSARSEADLMRAEVAAMQNVIDEIERRPTPPPAPAPTPAPTPAPAPSRAADGPTEDLRRLVEVAKELAEGSERGGDRRVDAEDELSDLEARVAKLRKKRRQMKRRIERESARLRQERDALAREVRNAEAARERIRQETETLAARIAAEAASVLDDAMRERVEAQIARQAAIEHASAELATLEAGIETVVIDANALRVKLAAIRTNLLNAKTTPPE